MANIKELILSIESTDSSFEEKLAAITEMQATVEALQIQEEQAVQDNVDLIVEALKTIEAKVEAKLKEIPEKGDQGIQGPKGEKGDRGLDGAQGKDGLPGRDGKDGLNGRDGVGVQDAKIDFDGSLVITLTDGREINVGEVVPVDVAENIHKVTHSIQSGSGGDSQTTLNAIAALQATIATYGTMSTQNANNVAITGGAIDNTTIGATTPSTGVFTTLTATGQTSLGGASGAEAARFFSAASIVNQWNFFGGVTGGQPNLVAGGTNTDVNALFQTKGTGAHRFKTGSTDNSGNGSVEQVRFTHTASAVNYVQVTGAATGGRPVISAQGSDSAIGLTFTAKGAGLQAFNNGNGTQLVLQDYGATTVNRIEITPSATTVAPKIVAGGTDTNISLVLSPKGTGALQAQQADGTATGGNARGVNAVDWQTIRDAAQKVASGAYSVVTGGYGNQATGQYAINLGGAFNNSNSAYTGVYGGTNNTASLPFGTIVNGSGNSASGYYNFIGAGFTNSGTALATVTTQSATMNGTTAVTLAASNASIKVGQYITGTSIAGDTYVAAVSGTSLTLSKNASGSSTSTLSFYTPHGVVVGGGNNQATGAYSFIGGGGDAGTAANRNVASGDWSTVAGGRTNQATGIASFIGGGGFYGTGGNANVASGIGSVVVGGWGNQATNTAASVLGGAYNINTGEYSSILSGQLGSTRAIKGYSVFSAVNPFSSTQGGSQTGIVVLAKQTTDATASVLTVDATAASAVNQVILPNNSAYYFRGEVVSGVTGGGNTKGWTIEGVIKRGANAASTTLVGSTVTSMYADAGAVTWTIALSADTTNGGLAVTFTGQAATTIRTVAQIRTTEMTY